MGYNGFNRLLEGFGMHIFADQRTYEFPGNKFSCWKYAGSLVGLDAEYRFTNHGIDVLNTWADRIGDEELTDARRGELQLSYIDVMADLIESGDAWKHRNDEFRISAFWWLTTTANTG